MELIDKRAVINAILNTRDVNIFKKENPAAAALFNRLLNAIESVEAVEKRPAGKWRIEPAIGCYCSNCDFDIGNDFDSMEYVNYCPSCGAIMGREDNALY